MNSVRETIGFVMCPFSGHKSEVRVNKNGKLYYVGNGGQITPNKPAGQAWLKENMIPLDDGAKEAVNAAPLEFGQRMVQPPTADEVSTSETVSVTDPIPEQPPQTTEPQEKEGDSWSTVI